MIDTTQTTVITDDFIGNVMLLSESRLLWAAFGDRRFEEEQLDVSFHRRVLMMAHTNVVEERSGARIRKRTCFCVRIGAKKMYLVPVQGG